MKFYNDLLKMYATFWGGVEVACCYTSKGHSILPIVVRAIVIHFMGTTPLGFSLSLL